MRPPVAVWALTGLLLTSCSQIFDAMVNAESPHSLSASRGEGYSISLSWSPPRFPEGDGTTVSSYSVERDGLTVGTTASSSWSDTSVTYGTKYSYRVRATLEKGGAQRTSGYSNSDTGWCIPGTVLKLGVRAGAYTSASDSGWYKTYVYSGWTYHFQAVSVPGASVDIRDWDDPDAILASGTGSLPWTSGRTKKVWVRANPASSLTAWYE